VSPGAADPAPSSFLDAPLPASGLPKRILAALRAAGARTLRDLDPAPPECPGLDDADRSLLRRVAAWSRAASAGTPPDLSLSEWLALFLPRRLAEVLRLHYALDHPAAGLALHECRLRDTGGRLGVTRERARQLLATAFDSLRQALPLAAAAPLFRAADDDLRAHGGVLAGPELADLRGTAWTGVSPVGAFLLLTRLLPGRLVLYRGFFCACSDLQAERVETALRDRLAPSPGLLTITEIARGLPPAARLPGDLPAEPLIRALLRHLPDTLVTRDDRAGLLERDAPVLLHEILAESGEMPLAGLVDAFNDRVAPECRRGSGTLRNLLLRDPRVRRTAPGRYALPGGHQTQLPLDHPPARA